MKNQQTQSEEAGARSTDRRRFLIASGLGSAGLMLFPFRTAGAQGRFLLVEAVLTIANAMGSSVLATNIIEYVRRSYIPVPTEHEVYAANNEMAQDQIGRFTDLSRSSVYSPESSYFFYAAVSQDRFNTCVAFFDRSRAERRQRIALIEGPTLYAIGRATQDVARRYSSAQARRIFLPRNVLSRGTGAWNLSYATPDIYQTDAGTVAANYATDGNGKGYVAVRARNERGALLASGDYPLTYTTA